MYKPVLWWKSIFYSALETNNLWLDKFQPLSIGVSALSAGALIFKIIIKKITKYSQYDII